MFQPTLLFLPDICLYTLSVLLLRFVELGETRSMTFSLGIKATSQSQKMIDFWDEFARNLRLLLAMAVW